jgi:hypothetical protein
MAIGMFHPAFEITFGSQAIVGVVTRAPGRWQALSRRGRGEDPGRLRARPCGPEARVRAGATDGACPVVY